MLTTRLTDLVGQQHLLARWPCGRIVMRQGCLVEVRCGLLPRRASILRVWWDNRFRPLGEDTCVLHYHRPLLAGYLCLDYLVAGPATRWATIGGALRVLDEVARRRRAVAIFAHVSTVRISDAVLLRQGWKPVSQGSPERLWVRRFYNGYPHGRPLPEAADASGGQRK